MSEDKFQENLNKLISIQKWELYVFQFLQESPLDCHDQETDKMGSLLLVQLAPIQSHAGILQTLSSVKHQCLLQVANYML